MSSDDLKSRAQALRAAGNTPKQIARMLGIPRSKVVSLVHSGPGLRPDRAVTPEPHLIGCWITRQWSNGLTVENRPSDWIDDDELSPLVMGAGLPNLVVVREPGKPPDDRRSRGELLHENKQAGRQETPLPSGEISLKGAVSVWFRCCQAVKSAGKVLVGTTEAERGCTKFQPPLSSMPMRILMVTVGAPGALDGGRDDVVEQATLPRQG